MQNGLSAAIINPNSEAMMRAYYSFRALMNLDPAVQRVHFCLQRAGGQPGAERGNRKWRRLSSRRSVRDSRQSGTSDLRASIVEGTNETRRCRRQRNCWKFRMPWRSSTARSFRHWTVVGKGFEKGTMFLPQLLMSAEAAKGAFEVIKEKMDASGQKQEKKGKIILATVKGDIHDIGKNIVKVLLENYSYDVLDLGKDVPPETIVETAVEKHIRTGGTVCADDHHGAAAWKKPSYSCARQLPGKGDGGRRRADSGICQIPWSRRSTAAMPWLP
ncbi:MAG: cobalamin-dependent protein [Clostridium sp.]